MALTRVYAGPDRARAKAAAKAQGGVPVALYNTGTERLPGLGKWLLKSTKQLPRAPSVRAWDFLSFALSVFAADRFVLRNEAADGWTREIDLTVELMEPAPWNAHGRALADALTFLTGDIWRVSFKDGGIGPPDVKQTNTDRDCVCLFSGGMDSLIGALDLVAKGRSPLLVSQASPKEGGVQAELATAIGLGAHRFEGRVRERFKPPYEPSCRARSLLFISYGALAASALVADIGAPVTVYVPENGLIAINPPLTYRRLGSLSTRTTHPYFIGSIQKVLDAVGIEAKILNPYGSKTKGEMLKACGDDRIRKLAHLSYSCGKGKRLNKQCGRCVPCLIRRAAMDYAAVKDKTPYYAVNLAVEGSNDDVLAVRLATAALKQRDLERWTVASGPLPSDTAQRALYVDVVRRGLNELRSFVGTIAWL
ncbi:MAG: 7-cyano-7-deazaguanine synthase [Anaeromyxobacter sp.]